MKRKKKQSFQMKEELTICFEKKLAERKAKNLRKDR